MSSQPAADPDAYTDELASESRAGGSATDWFDAVYRAADQGRATLPWDRGEPHPLLLEWVARDSMRGDGRSAVVVGAGRGYDAELLSQLGYATTAFDVSPTAMATARRRFPETAVDYRPANLLELAAEWRQSFDLVVEIFTVQSLPRRVRAQATAAVRGLVAPGGTLFVVSSVSEPGDAEGPPWPLTEAELRAFAGDELTPVTVDELTDPHRWRAEFRRDY